MADAGARERRRDSTKNPGQREVERAVHHECRKRAFPLLRRRHVEGARYDRQFIAPSPLSSLKKVLDDEVNLRALSGRQLERGQCPGRGFASVIDSGPLLEPELASSKTLEASAGDAKTSTV